jgi:hypothetical protein
MSLQEIGLTRRDDEPLLRALATRTDEWVLVTGDDQMPGEHAVRDL